MWSMLVLNWVCETTWLIVRFRLLQELEKVNKPARSKSIGYLKMVLLCKYCNVVGIIRDFQTLSPIKFMCTK